VVSADEQTFWTMLTLRFEIENDWAFPPSAGGAALHSLKRGRRMSVDPCVSPECCAKKASLSSPVSGAGARSFESGCGRGALFPALNPAEVDEENGDKDETLRGGRSERMTMRRMSEAQEFPFGVGGDFGDDEDFDLGPPPPTGPVLMRQRAMDFTAAKEAKAASLAQSVDPRATASPSAALRSTSRISSSSALNRRSHFMGV